jgi:hypothetical protein
MNLKIKDLLQTAQLWPQFVKLSFPVRLAYELSSYSRKIEEELQAIDTARRRLICEAAGVDEGTENVSLDPNSEAGKKCQQDFAAFLETDSDVMPFPKRRMEILDAIENNPRNNPAVEVMAILDIFFGE